MPYKSSLSLDSTHDPDSTVGQAFYSKYDEKHDVADTDSSVGQAFYNKKYTQKHADDVEDSAVGQSFYSKYTETNKFPTFRLKFSPGAKRAVPCDRHIRFMGLTKGIIAGAAMK